MDVARARLGHADEHRLLLRGKALDRLDEVRDEIGATLVLVDHLRPGGLHGLVLGLDGVVAATAQGQRHHEHQHSKDLFLHMVVPRGGDDPAGSRRHRSALISPDFHTRGRLAVQPVATLDSEPAAMVRGSVLD
jgi:hypothetical protein